MLLVMIPKRLPPRFTTGLIRNVVGVQDREKNFDFQLRWEEY